MLKLKIRLKMVTDKLRHPPPHWWLTNISQVENSLPGVWNGKGHRMVSSKHLNTKKNNLHSMLVVDFFVVSFVAYQLF